ncbi:MAG: orotate phosphoribosyltransferase [Chitinophagales bacterium]|nr:orotate phosphoribosyltransferase [Chitinophagales bacterium]
MIYADNIADKVAEYLLQVKAIKLQPQQPFTWSSGWKSPIYCDNRVTLSDPSIRTYIKEQLADLVRENFFEVDIIVGVATAGIAQGALVADYLQLPFAYVRPEPKTHGLGKQIEGAVEAGQKVVLIEDLISTGGSSIKAIQPLVNVGCEVLGVAAIFDYGFETARENFKEAGYSYYSLSNYDTLLPVAIKQGMIRQSDLEVLRDWRRNPDKWGNRF